MGVDVKNLNPEIPIETVISGALQKPLMKLGPNPFLKNYMRFKAPDWFQKFSFGYGIVALATSALLYVNGVFDLKRQEALDKKLEMVRLDLNHFE